MPVDEQILVAGTSSVPLSYTVPNSIEAALLCVNATIDGTAASGSFYAAVEIISDGGVVVARCPCFTTIAVGGTAEISWFRLRSATATSSSSSVYQQTILTTPNLYSYWTLDETSGTTFADSGPFNLPLTITGTPLLGNTPLIHTGHSAVFSGAVDGIGRAQQYAQSSASFGAGPGSGSQTIEAWINTTFSGASSPQILCADDDHFRYFQFRLNPAGQVEYITFNATLTVATTLASVSAVNNGTRHYVVGTVDATSLTQKVYVDTVLENSVAVGSLNTGATPLVTIAARLAGGVTETPIGGTIDEVAFYSRALTQAEITAHYNAGK